MNPRQLILLLAAATLSLAAGCPFAKFAKAGDGVPELDHDKLSAFIAKMKEYAPQEGYSLGGEAPDSRQTDFRSEL